MALPENRLLIVEPGDVLVIGHAPDLTSEEADRLTRMLGLSAVIAVPGDVDLATIRADQEVQVVVSVPPGAATAIDQEVRRIARTRPGAG